MILLIISILGLGSILISFIATSLLYKFMFLGMGIFIFLTAGLRYLNFLLVQSLNTAKNNNSQTNNTNNRYNNNNKSNSGKVTKIDKKDTKNYPIKTVNNPHYDELISCIKYSMKNRLLTREQVLDFRKVVCEHLGEFNDNYRDFKFSNDLHEIYTKTKNKHLKSQDYQELLQILQNYKTS